MPYSISTEAYAGGPLIVVRGDADVRAAEELQNALDHQAALVVTVDLAEATLIDSRTIAVLMTTTEALRARGGMLVLVCDRPEILRLFRRIGLESELDIVADRDRAVRRTMAVE